MTMTKAYTLTPARYARGMVAIHCTPGGDGYKTRAMSLASHFARARYSGREHAYIMSKAAAAKFEKHYADGFDANNISGKLVAPRASS